MRAQTTKTAVKDGCKASLYTYVRILMLWLLLVQPTKAQNVKSSWSNGQAVHSVSRITASLSHPSTMFQIRGPPVAACAP
ncbi:hypothetical protein J3F83DRAFT_742686 [Trichoderma novae-zelandiae]